MKLLLRILLGCTVPFLGLSLLLGCVLLFASAFVIPLTVENQTGRAILVTPVGTLHAGVEGPTRKSPLPLMLSRLAFPSPRVGGFRLEPHASRTFFYDRDDITCTELVLEDAQGRLRQYVARSSSNPNSAPASSEAQHHVLTDLGALSEPSPEVLAAFVAARESKWGLLIGLLLFLIGPWVLSGVLLRGLARLRTSAPPNHLQGDQTPRVACPYLLGRTFQA